MIIDLNSEDNRWADLPLQQLAKDAASTTLSHLKISAQTCQISLLACNDQRIAKLNADFRDRENATNVLSWPACDLSAPQPGGLPDRPKPGAGGDIALGDIALAWETCQLEAHQAGRPMGDHITHLLVHAVLHLLGYDHIRDPDATLMMQNEIEILGKLGISNPY